MELAETDRMDARINRLGASLFFHPTTTGYAASKGIDNVFVMYAGRAGVMGDITADQIVSAFAFFSESVVNDVWEGMKSFGSPSQIGSVFAEGMALAAAELWDETAGADVIRLGRKVIDSVEPMGMALFAAWRRSASETPDASRVVQALRELRGDVHIQSVASRGLSPLEAEMVTRGEAGAQLHGYKPPYPDPAPFVERVAEASLHTSQRMHAIYAKALTVEELDLFSGAVSRLATASSPTA